MAGMRTDALPGVGPVIDECEFVVELAGTGVVTAPELRTYMSLSFTTPETISGAYVPKLMTEDPSVVSEASIGNALHSSSGFSYYGTTADPQFWENGISVQLINDTGHGIANKVAIYTAIEATGPNSGDSWAFNPVLVVDPGALPSAAHQIAEFDIANNSGTHYGDAVAALSPAIYGMQVTGLGQNRCTAAIAIFGNLPAAAPMWNRGIVFSNNSIRMATIQDFTNSTTSYEVRGTHDYGIDFNFGAFTAAPIRLANSQAIAVRNIANTLNLNILSLGVGDSVQLGGTGVTAAFVRTNTGLFPATDNALALGQPSNRWAAVYAANGAIQTSDPALKTAVEPLPSMLGVLADVDPVTFRWIDGGAEVQPNGANVHHAGRRTHWGFLAPDVKAAFDNLGMDFGGYVQTPDGTHNLRPDQLIPVLWRICQELAAKVEALEEANVGV